MHLFAYSEPVAYLVMINLLNMHILMYNLSLIFSMPFTDKIILIISLDMSSKSPRAVQVTGKMLHI